MHLPFIQHGSQGFQSALDRLLLRGKFVSACLSLAIAIAIAITLLDGRVSRCLARSPE